MKKNEKEFIEVSESWDDIKDTAIRNSRESDILDILIKMQSRTQGICIDDIMKEFGKSRSTAERWLNCIKIIIPQVVEIDNFNSKKKYWGFKHAYMSEIINVKPEEIANLEQLKTEQEQKGFKDKAKMIGNTIDHLNILLKKYNTKIDNSIEILMQTEGYAVRQMPKFNIHLDTLSVIREALKTNTKISAKYNDKPRTLSPLGLIYGEKIYLIAYEPKKGDIPYYYLMHKLENVKLTRDKFDKGDFNLDEYSKKSFGIYQGEIQDVKLLFSKNVANEVLNYNFHSTQKMKQKEDGSVVVKFKASGEYEILWHLFRWGADVKILSPNSLRKQYIEMLSNALNKQKEK